MGKQYIKGIIVVFGFFIFYLSCGFCQQQDVDSYNVVVTKALDDFEVHRLSGHRSAGGDTSSARRPVLVNKIIEGHSDSSDMVLSGNSKVEYDSAKRYPLEPADVDTHSQDYDKIYSLDADDSNIIDVLHDISTKSGLDIIAADGITGKITLHLSDIDAMDALRIVSGLKGLAFFQEGKTIHVITARQFKEKYGYPFNKDIAVRAIKIKYADSNKILAKLKALKGKKDRLIYDADTRTLIIESSPSGAQRMLSIVHRMDIPVKTEAFILQYVQPSEVLNKIRPILTRDIGEAYLDRSTNSIVITDTVLKMKTVEQLIKKIDKQDKEVHVAVKIIQAVLDDEYSDGIDWEAIVSDYKKLVFAGFQGSIKSGHSKLSFGTVNAEDFVVLLDALDTVGIIRTISNANISFSEGNSEEITINSNELDLFPGGSDKSRNVSNVKEVKFRLTPTISDKDMVIMEISPQSVYRLGSHALNTPTAHTASVMVAVENGATIVIGGLMKEEMIASVHKIPLLGDIPLLGRAFRSQGRRLKNTEVIVFLTTTVVVKKGQVK